MLLKLRLPAELELEKLSVQMHRWVAVNQQGQESKAQEAAGSTYLYPLRVAQAASRTLRVRGRNRGRVAGVGAQHRALGAFCSILSKTDGTSAAGAIPLWLAGRADEFWVQRGRCVAFCTASFLKFLGIQSKLLGLEPRWREGQVHAKYL